MKKNIVFIFICTFISCSNKITLIGNYSTDDYMQKIELKADSTYYYLYRYEWPLSESKGKWKIIDENLIELNEFYDLENLPISVIELHSKESEMIDFKVNIPNFDTLTLNCLVFELLLNGKETIKQSKPMFKIPSSKKGINTFAVRVIFKNDSLYSIYHTRPDLTTNVYKIKNSDSNYFEITIPIEGYMLNGVPVKKDTVKVKGNKLFWNKNGKGDFKKVND